MAHESSDGPADFGTHQPLNNSGLLHASKTMCAGALNVRVTTSSRSDLRSTAVRFMAAGLPSFPSRICLLLAFQVLDNLVQRVEACAPELAVPLDPVGLFFQRAHAKSAGSDAPGLFSSDERCPLQHANMLLHAREGHMELSGEVRDRSVGAAELLEHAAPGRVRQRGERSVEAGFVILNHIVQYIAGRLAACKREGAGCYQERGKPARVVRKGEVIKCAPGVEHWQGATPNSGFAPYLAVTLTQRGKTIWLEPVSDEDYNSAK